MMNPSPLETLRQASAFLRAWLDEAQSSPDFASPASCSLAEIARRMRLVDELLHGLPPAIAKDETWRKAVAEYQSVLFELKEKLSTLEITLKIRQSQLTRKRANLSAIRGWADLAGRIG